MGFWKLFTSITVGGSKCAFDAEYEEMSDEDLIREFQRWNGKAGYAGFANVEAQLNMYDAQFDSSMSQESKRVISIYDVFCKRNGKAEARRKLFSRAGL